MVLLLIKNLSRVHLCSSEGLTSGVFFRLIDRELSLLLLLLVLTVSSVLSVLLSLLSTSEYDRFLLLEAVDQCPKLLKLFNGA